MYKMPNGCHTYVRILALVMSSLVTKGLQQCKWSNENCAADDECCSESCVKLHVGTDPRCASSPLHYPCFYGYQCEEELACGKKYSCCAPAWGVCTSLDDCCEKDHMCREVDGFIYNRCLPNHFPVLVSWTSSVNLLILVSLFHLYVT